VRWLRPLPQIERASAGVGHVNISTESDGARVNYRSESRQSGNGLWSIAVEAVRVGDGLSESAVLDQPGAVTLGSRTLLLASDPHRLKFALPDTNGKIVNLRDDRAALDYIGRAALSRRALTVSRTF